MLFMRNRHGVSASINQYKRKFGKWGSRQYRKRARSPAMPSAPTAKLSSPHVPDVSPESESEEDGLISDIAVTDKAFRDVDASATLLEIMPCKTTIDGVSVEPKTLEKQPHEVGIEKGWMAAFVSTLDLPNPAETYTTKQIMSFMIESKVAVSHDFKTDLQDAEGFLEYSQWEMIVLRLLGGAFQGLEHVVRSAITKLRYEVLWLLPFLSPQQRQYTVQHLDKDARMQYVCLILSEWGPYQHQHFAKYAELTSLSHGGAQEAVTSFLRELTPFFHGVLDHVSYIENTSRINPPKGWCPSISSTTLVCRSGEVQESVGTHDMALSVAEEVQFLTQSGTEPQLRRLRVFFKRECIALASGIIYYLSIRKGRETEAMGTLRRRLLRQNLPKAGWAINVDNSKHMRAWNFAMASLHNLAKARSTIGFEDAYFMLCLARAVQASGSIGQESHLAQLFLADLSNWVHIISDDEKFDETTQISDTGMFCTILRLTWRLEVVDDGSGRDPQQSSIIRERMLAAARHLVRLTLRSLGIEKVQSKRWEYDSVRTGKPCDDEAVRAQPRASQRVPPGKDPPSVQAGVAAFVVTAVAAASAIGFILGLIIALVSIVANMVRCVPMSTAASRGLQFEVFAATQHCSETTFDPPLASRAVTPEFEVWRPQVSASPGEVVESFWPSHENDLAI